MPALAPAMQSHAVNRKANMNGLSPVVGNENAAIPENLRVIPEHHLFLKTGNKITP